MQRPPFTIGRFHGVEIRVHGVWLVGVPLIGLLAATGSDSLQAAGAYLLLPVVWALSVLAHEAGHAVMAARLGHRVDSVSLLPMGGATVYDGPPLRSRDQMLISGAGPGVSLLLAALAGATAWGTNVGWWYHIAAFNAGVFIVNGLPALPLDGGRALRAALRSSGWDPLTAERDSRWVGQATAYLLAVVTGIVLARASLDPFFRVMLAAGLIATALMLLRCNARPSPLPVVMTVARRPGGDGSAHLPGPH